MCSFATSVGRCLIGDWADSRFGSSPQNWFGAIALDSAITFFLTIFGLSDLLVGSFEPSPAVFDSGPVCSPDYS